MDCEPESFTILSCKWSFLLDAGLEVEVKDPPKGMIPPGTQMVKPKAEPQPSKVSFFFWLTNRGMNMHINTPMECMHACNHPSDKAQQRTETISPVLWTPLCNYNNFN